MIYFHLVKKILAIFLLRKYNGDSFPVWVSGMERRLTGYTGQIQDHQGTQQARTQRGLARRTQSAGCPKDHQRDPEIIAVSRKAGQGSPSHEKSQFTVHSHGLRR